LIIIQQNMLNLIHKMFTLILNQQGLVNSVFKLTRNALLYKNTGTIHANIKLHSCKYKAWKVKRFKRENNGHIAITQRRR